MELIQKQGKIPQLTSIPPHEAISLSTPVRVIIGSGPVGMQAAAESLSRDARNPVVVYGDEPWDPYNRIFLSQVLNHERSSESLRIEVDKNHRHNLQLRINCQVSAIDPHAKTVTDIFGRVQSYRELILATGSRPKKLTAMTGLDKSGVYLFRTLSDVFSLQRLTGANRRVIVLGGGLLGLEAAYGLRQIASVTLIQSAPILMPQQLDQKASELLCQHIKALGINVILQQRVKQLLGGAAVSGVMLENGEIHACDAVVVCMGTQPNVELAQQAGLAVGTGIQVNKYMQTSIAGIYAIGECAEYQGKIHSLVAPGYQQACTAIEHILGYYHPYQSLTSVTRLKVSGLTVISIGKTNLFEKSPMTRTLVYHNPSQGIYRKLILHHGHLVGAIGIGHWPDISHIQASIEHAKRLWIWQKRQFYRRGNVISINNSFQQQSLLSDTVVCKCMGVNRRTLDQAKENGCITLDMLCQKTGAGTICGSCKPEIAKIMRMDPVKNSSPQNKKLTLLACATLLIVALHLVMTPVPFIKTADIDWRYDTLWSDPILKQISGYTILVISAIAAGLSIRKRIVKAKLGNYSRWISIHVILGMLAIVMLFIHSGLRLGTGINFILALSFICTILLGALSVLTSELTARFSVPVASKWRHVLVLSHTMATWPLPFLLGFHILATYYF